MQDGASPPLASSPLFGRPALLLLAGRPFWVEITHDLSPSVQNGKFRIRRKFGPPTLSAGITHES